METYPWELQHNFKKHYNEKHNDSRHKILEFEYKIINTHNNLPNGEENHKARNLIKVIKNKIDLANESGFPILFNVVFEYAHNASINFEVPILPTFLHKRADDVLFMDNCILNNNETDFIENTKKIYPSPINTDGSPSFNENENYKNDTQQQLIDIIEHIMQELLIKYCYYKSVPGLRNFIENLDFFKGNNLKKSGVKLVDLYNNTSGLYNNDDTSYEQQLKNIETYLNLEYYNENNNDPYQVVYTGSGTIMHFIGLEKILFGDKINNFNKQKLINLTMKRLRSSNKIQLNECSFLNKYFDSYNNINSRSNEQLNSIKQQSL
ncbi:MAG: hypothetical protein IJ538_00300 [Clostridia bacterium]|nr:hypothetical protein [Clostridia bacterium]